MDKQLANYDAMKDRLDDIHAEQQRSNLIVPGGENLNAEQKAEMDQFMSYARSGQVDLRNATTMQVKSNPDGGYTVPQQTSQRIITTSEGNNPVAMLAAREQTSGNSLDVIIDPDELGYEENAEGSAASDTDTPEILVTNIPLVKIDAEPKVTRELLQDSAWDLESYLERKGGRIFRKRLNTQFTTGDGVKQCRGFMSYTAVANATFEAGVVSNWGSIGYTPSGAAATITTADALLDLTAAVQDIYLPNSSFQMRRATLNLCRKIKMTLSTAGDNAYALWTPSFQPGVPDSLIGYPVYKNDAVPAVAANALAIAFGDMEEAYTIVDKPGGMWMIRDEVTNKAVIKFYMARRVGGGVVNFEALKYMKVATS
jgi:HK97 family phage major capsid protein